MNLLSREITSRGAALVLCTAFLFGGIVCLRAAHRFATDSLTKRDQHFDPAVYLFDDGVRLPFFSGIVLVGLGILFAIPMVLPIRKD